MPPGPSAPAAAALTRHREGLPLIRAAKPGVSAVIDPFGRFDARLGLDVEGVLDSSLPERSHLQLTRELVTFRRRPAVVLAAIFVLRRRMVKADS